MTGASPPAGVGIVGSGDIGATVAALCVANGIEVALSNSRGPQSLAPLVERLGPLARAASVEEAAGFGDLVLLAIPFFAHAELAPGLFDGRVVVDACNWFPGRDGPTPELVSGQLVSTEWLGRHFAGARMVKALHNLNFAVLANEADRGLPNDRRVAVLVAADDAGAKALASAWLDALGLGVLDVGPLHDGGLRASPGSPLFNNPMTVADASSIHTTMLESR